MLINVLCDAPEQFEAALEAAEKANKAKGEAAETAFGEIMIESAKFPEDSYRENVRRCHEAGCGCRLALPYIFRDKAEKWFEKNKQVIAEAQFDGYLVRSLSEFSVVQEIVAAQEGTLLQCGSSACIAEDAWEKGTKALIKTDYNMYTMNAGAKEVLAGLGADMLTAPVELNERELHILDISDMEMIVYGRIPMMITAQCIRKSLGGCGGSGNVQIKDRKGKCMPVENICRLCYNLVYNAVPLSMAGVKEKILKLSPKAVRVSFTTEDGALCRNILKAYADTFGGEAGAAGHDGKSSRRPAAGHNEGRGGNIEPRRTVEEPVAEYTRGHFSRGVE